MHRIRVAAAHRARLVRPGLRFKGRRGRPVRRRALSPPTLAIALPAMALGAALEYFLDPRSGRRRRKVLRDRARGTVHRRTRQLERHAHYEAGKVIGFAHAIAHRDRGRPELDDISLVRKVESELFRDRTIPKGQISINADRGIVVLRGQLQDKHQIERVQRAVRKVAGVREVENLLHPPGTPAPPSHSHGHPRNLRPAA